MKPSSPRMHLYKQIVDAKLYIDDFYMNAIDLELIASRACISKFHFHRIFKACYNKTPHEYLTHLRIKHAKQLLSNGSPTPDVCLTVGFESLSSFCKLFKKKESVTPAEYRAMTLRQNKLYKHQPLNFIPNGYASYLGWE